MKIIIKTKNIEPTEALQVFIEEKLFGLQKFINILRSDGEVGKTLAEIFVEVEKETEHHKKGHIFRAEARIRLPAKTLVAISEQENLERAIVKVKDELQQEIKKYKLKNVKIKRRQRRVFKIKNFRYDSN